MKKEIKLNSFVLYPVWLLILLPNYWLLLAASVLIIQSIVLIGALKHLQFDDVSKIWRKSILWNTFYGFLSYLVAAGLFSITLFVRSDNSVGKWFIANVSDPLIQNPFSNVFALLYALLVLLITGLLIFVANRAISFRKTELNPLGVKKVSLYLAIFTAPYVVLLPSTSFYSSVVGMIQFLFLH